MLSWCAYCQRFQGEHPPYDTFEVSHGVCATCASLGLRTSHTLERARELRRIQRQLALAGRNDLASASHIVDEATRAGILPIDILMGLAIPALSDIGKAWENGTITVAQEHRFTAFCEQLFEVVADKERIDARELGHDTDPRAEIVVVDAPGNHHTFGSRVLATWLRSIGRTATLIPTELPLDDKVRLVVQAKPRIIAISVALAEQRVGAVALVERLASALPGGARIAVGGHAVKHGLLEEIPGATLVDHIRSL